MMKIRDNNLWKKHNYVPHLVIFLIVLLLMLFWSPYSPLNRYVYDNDAVCYDAVARAIATGKMPYRDIFDHKGPITYFFVLFGYLICPGRLGVWFLYLIFDFLSFIFAYKIAKLFFSNRQAFLGTVVTIAILGLFSDDTVFSSGSRPENILLLPLMYSAYIFLRALRDNYPKKPIGTKNILMLGLCCGIVFMLKMNVCLYYFVFVGLYFLWLLINKHFSSFFVEVSVFLAGILMVSIPFVIWLYTNGAFKDFIDVYFLFNIKYAGVEAKEFFLFRSGLSIYVRLCVMLLFVAGIISIVMDIKKKKNLSYIFLEFASLFVFIALTISTVFEYFFIVFLPLFVLIVTKFLALITIDKKSALQLCGMICFSMTLFNTICFVRVPPSLKKGEFETTIQNYAEAHPDAECMFFSSICRPIYLDYLDPVSETAMFYVPPTPTSEMIREQLRIIEEGNAEVIAVVRNEAFDLRSSAIYEFLTENGYELLCSNESEGGPDFAFVRTQ